ncbi:YlxR family protein [Myxococcota bacterium]|nr:YlxR family protein [Myxococcota bacterium]
MTGSGTSHVPLRRCLGCGRQRPQRELVRLAVGPSGDVSVDLERRLSGRGAYLCPQSTCLKRALARGSVPRALRVSTGGTAWVEAFPLSQT